MEDNKTFYDLLCEGIKVGELVDAIEAGKVRIFDKFGRDNQAPSSEDISELKSQLLYHQNMIWEKDLPVSMRSDDCNMYWQAGWIFLLDCCGDLPPILARAWIIGKPDKNLKSKNNPFDSEAGRALNRLKTEPKEAIKEEIIRILPDIIGRAKRPYTHNLIALDIHSMEESGVRRFDLSVDLIRGVVKKQCRHMNRTDLIKGVKQSK